MVAVSPVSTFTLLDCLRTRCTLASAVALGCLRGEFVWSVFVSGCVCDVWEKVIFSLLKALSFYPCSTLLWAEVKLCLSVFAFLFSLTFPRRPFHSAVFCRASVQSSRSLGNWWPRQYLIKVGGFQSHWPTWEIVKHWNASWRMEKILGGNFNVNLFRLKWHPCETLWHFKETQPRFGCIRPRGSVHCSTTDGR